MGFRRGFKTEANSLTADVRAELGLSMFDPLDPHVLAAWLEIPIVRLSEFADQAQPSGICSKSSKRLFLPSRYSLAQGERSSTTMPTPPLGSAVTPPTSWPTGCCSIRRRPRSY